MKKVIHYALILDQSGSMQHLKKEVISSFNEQVEMMLKRINTDPEVRIKVTLCSFNDEVEFKYVAQNIRRLKKLTAYDYRPHSCTALYDAIGSTVMKMNQVALSKDNVFVAIFTDGLENASQYYSAGDVRFKIKEAETAGWNIRFFCRYEDKVYYKNNLDITDTNLHSISLNEQGLAEVNEEIMCCLDSMINYSKSKN